MKLYKYEEAHNSYLRANGAECTVLLKKDGHFPLKKATSIALYGNGVRNTIKGGSGSGEVNSRYYVTAEQGFINAGFTISNRDWLDGYDLIRKKAERAFINGVRAEARVRHKDAYLLGMGRIMSEPEYDLPIGKGDTAIYILSRISGEGCDRQPIKGDIFLTDTERRDILRCNAQYKNFMLVINAGGVVDLSEVRDVKNILVLSQLGVETGSILADIILGTSNPSGKLTTTWASWNDYPTIGSFGELDDTRYQEGIYVGYRYFDSVGKRAMFPFGYGLSFTDFDISERDFSIDGECLTVSAKVSNIGKHSGKEVVELYVSAPNGKLDKPYQSLVAFAKTRLLAPGESETVCIKVMLAELASYDESKAEYVLEKGNYILRVGNSSDNTACAGVLELAHKQVAAKVRNVLGKPDFKDFVPDIKQADEDYSSIKHLTFNGRINCFEPDYNRSYGIEPIVEELTTEQVVALNIGAFNMTNAMASEVGNAGFTVAGAAGQTSVAAVSQGIPSLVMADGPAGLRISKRYALDKDGVVHTLGATLPDSMLMFMTNEMKRDIRKRDYKPTSTDKIRHQYTTAIPIGTAIAQSFNVDFARECGRIVGYEMNKFGVQLWLAPALNIHRSIQCGRNFEYYSEDPVVSGEFCAAITLGVQSTSGCGVTIKHYAANNQETNRVQNNSQVSERAMREIYLKGFQIAVRKSSPAAVMTSYNLINGIHTSEHAGLLLDILRTEFGHKELIMTDWNVGNFNAEQNLKYPLANPSRSAAAGDNIYMPGGQGDYDEIMRALKAGEISYDMLKANASYVVRLSKKLCK